MTKISDLLECQVEALIKDFLCSFQMTLRKKTFILKLSNLWQRNSTQISGAIPAGELCFKELL